MSHRFEPLADDRRSIRLRGFDYALDGAYFVTVCVAGRKRILGRIRNGTAILSEAGHLVVTAWERLPLHYPRVRLDAFVVMPNHVHGIVVLDGVVGTGRSGASGGRRETGEVGAGRSGASGSRREAGQVGAGRSGASDGRPETGQVGAGLRPAPTVARAPIPTSGGVPDPRRHALPEIVRAFKAFSARAINLRRGTPGTPVWQRNYYERILRDERALAAVRRYIRENPAKWGDDRFH